jgi:hypothetical protein
MPQPIDVDPSSSTSASWVESGLTHENFAEAQHFAEAQDEADVDAYQQIAARRAQLEDAETLRRVRAL